MASALATSSRQVGNTLGVAVLASITVQHLSGPTTAELRACWAITLAVAITALALSIPRQ